ncbi:uncharacterized protein LOC127904180 [Populus trichocarpa]|uniref:uncharacterized protein LOC112323774 n=1 Tax=Populus trichocarpa TaxID=3694 RepID=UPI000D189636|nr:uncharacterized protein LOC112323774 [Populus trichocarpa]XP_052302355.1 uncharacterized protein LOC127904180 [Populus trichocarpa]|eukprot:XP_024438873.1 uncharacterized protein LOC112323774 [Populus trichocarpa]
MKNLQKDQHVYFRGEKRKEEEKKLVCFVSRISSPRKFLLSGQSNDGLYVLSESSVMPIPQAFWSLCLSATVDLWHRCLGHPSPRILNLSAAAEQTSSVAGSPVSAVPTRPSTDSPAGLQLCVDLSVYPLQQLPGMRCGIVLYARKFRPHVLIKLGPWCRFTL